MAPAIQALTKQSTTTPARRLLIHTNRQAVHHRPLGV